VRRWIALGVLVALTAPTVAGGAQARAALSLTNLSPLTVRGVGFVPRERVAVLAFASGRYSRTVTAGAGGAFTVRFAKAHVERCGSYVIQARGNRGSRAFLKVMPECLPPVQGR
jgi:hypothetical protein